MATVAVTRFVDTNGSALMYPACSIREPTRARQLIFALAAIRWPEHGIGCAQLRHKLLESCRGCHRITLDFSSTPTRASSNVGHDVRSRVLRAVRSCNVTAKRLWSCSSAITPRPCRHEARRRRCSAAAGGGGSVSVSVSHQTCGGTEGMTPAVGSSLCCCRANMKSRARRRIRRLGSSADPSPAVGQRRRTRQPRAVGAVAPFHGLASEIMS